MIYQLLLNLCNTCIKFHECCMMNKKLKIKLLFKLFIVVGIEPKSGLQIAIQSFYRLEDKMRRCFRPMINHKRNLCGVNL